MDTEGHHGFGGTYCHFFGQRLPVDLSVFNIQVPRNENRTHRLNTTLSAMVEIAGDQLARSINDKAVVRKAPDMSTQDWYYMPRLLSADLLWPV
jgi:hypothetical protein